MITQITIENFKSIEKLSIDLGRINVFIGANGAGKSNILEVIAMLASERSALIETKDMISKGIRIAKPDLMISSFYGQKIVEEIRSSIYFKNLRNPECPLRYRIYNLNYLDVFSKWSCNVSLPVKGGEATKERIEEYDNERNEKKNYISQYLIYSLSTSALRGITRENYELPLGINGEGLDVLLNNLPQEEIERIKEIAENCIPWIDDILLDKEENYKMQGYKLGRSISNLYFRDKYMQKKNNLFSAENANEGALHLLFYLTLFISKRTPTFFGIDNIETGLNPRLCRYLMKNLASLAEANDKQALITTQNPAVLDGMNLHDDNQRLFVVARKDNGETKIERIKLKPMLEGKEMQNTLSDLWMKGFLGGIPDNF